MENQLEDAPRLNHFLTKEDVRRHLIVDAIACTCKECSSDKAQRDRLMSLSMDDLLERVSIIATATTIFKEHRLPVSKMLTKARRKLMSKYMQMQNINDPRYLKALNQPKA